MHLRHLTRMSLCLVLAGMLGCGDEQDEEAGKPAPPAPGDVQPMPASGHTVQWSTPGVPCEMKAGSTVAVSVIARNVGDHVWRDIPSSDNGRGAVRLGYRWWASGPGKLPVIDYSLTRGDLRAPVPPGSSATLTIEVVAPAAPGSYLLQLDLVEELITWFENTGAVKLMVPVTVS